jgi:hypothetical protein
MYDGFLRLLFLHARHEASVLANEQPDSGNRISFDFFALFVWLI